MPVTSSAAASSRCSQLSRTSSSSLVPEVGHQDLQRRRRGLVAQVQGCDHRVGHQGCVAKLGELDQPGAVREPTRKIAWQRGRQSGLADASRPDEADQSRVGQLLVESRPAHAGARRSSSPRREGCPIRRLGLATIKPTYADTRCPSNCESSIQTICAVGCAAQAERMTHRAAEPASPGDVRRDPSRATSRAGLRRQ